MKFNVKFPLLHLQFPSPGSGETKADVVGFDSDDVCGKHDEWFSGGDDYCSVLMSKANLLLFSGLTIDQLLLERCCLYFQLDQSPTCTGSPLQN